MNTLTIALASPRPARSLEDGLDRVRRQIFEAADRGARIVCFPEAYLPGLRGQDFEPFPWDRATQDLSLVTVGAWARARGIAVILGMENVEEGGNQIGAFVIGADGRLQGCQIKTQVDPSEDRFYRPGATRELFEVDGVSFGVVICHEGWRYPETVRWAAVRGAKIVFHPQHTGNDTSGAVLTEWGARDGAYYEKAMMMRSIENTIYFASVNYGLRYPEAATSLIAPTGRCQAYLPYGEEGVLVATIDLDLATGLLASRFAPERYPERDGKPSLEPTKGSR